MKRAQCREAHLVWSFYVITFYNYSARSLWQQAQRGNVWRVSPQKSMCLLYAVLLGNNAGRRDMWLHHHMLWSWSTAGLIPSVFMWIWGYLLSLMEHQPPSNHRIMGNRGKKLRQEKRNGDLMWSTVWWHTALAGEVQRRWWEVINGWMECGEPSSPVWKLQVCETHHRVHLRAARSHNCQPEHLACSLRKNVFLEATVTALTMTNLPLPPSGFRTHCLLLKTSAMLKQGTSDPESHSITFAYYCFAHRVLGMST